MESSMESMSTPRREIILHDGPGKGKKQCPKCKVYVGVRTQQCNCGHNWEKKTTEVHLPISPPSSDGAGRGKKQCPKCKNYYGVRTQACTCGYIWPRKDVKDERDQEEQPIESQYRERVLSTPAGLCPVKLGDMTANLANPKNEPIAAEELYAWADKLIALGRAQSIRYTPAALKYYLRHYYDMFTPLWQEAVGMLQNWVMNNSPVNQPEETSLEFATYGKEVEEEE